MAGDKATDPASGTHGDSVSLYLPKDAYPISPITAPTSFVRGEVASPREDNESPISPLISSPPPRPMAWKWKCHLCRSRYSLGVTNRCLSDGHYYCSGSPQTKKTKKSKKDRGGKPCTSEFDYIGWEKMNDWRKEVRRKKGLDPLPGCWETCNFPSECRSSRSEPSLSTTPTISSEPSDDSESFPQIKGGNVRVGAKSPPLTYITLHILPSSLHCVSYRIY